MSHRNSLRGYLRYTPIVLLLLALMVSATVVVPQGLAQSHEPPAGKLLIFVWGGPPDIESQQAAFDRYMELYPQVEIEMIHTQPECGADYAACKTFIAGGAMADVFVPGSWNYNAMALDGVLEDLGPYIERDGLNLADFNPVAMDAVTSLSDGKIVGLPMGYNVQSLWYNKDMFDAAGLPYPPANGDYTWDDVREWAKELTLDKNGNNAESPDFDRNNIVQWGFYDHFAWPWGNGYEPILFAYGGSSMTLPDRQTCNLEAPESIEAWQFIQDLMYEDYTTITPDLNAEQVGFLRWVGGQVAIEGGSFDQAALVQAQNPGLNYDIAAFPKGPAGNATVIQVHMWSIYSGSKNKELAWHLIKWLATDGACGNYVGGEMGSIMTLIPAYKDLAQGECFVQAPWSPEHTKEAQLDPTAWPLTTYPSMYNQKTDQIQGQDGFGGVISDILNNKKSAADALKGICKQVDEVMKQ